MATLEEIRASHPEWNISQVIDAPGGGQWAVGADGGVFALGGAAFRGSYTGLAPGDRQGTRSFTGITAANGGYTLKSNLGESYAFPGAAPAPPAAPTPPPAGTIDVNSPANQSAKAQIVSTLTAVGLPASLADDLWTNNYLNQGRPIQTIIDVDIPASDAFKAKFPAFGHFQAATGGTVKDYISTTDTYRGLMKASGLAEGFYDSPDDFARFINGDVSPKEVSDRISLAKQAAITAPPAVHNFLVNQEGLDANDLTAFFLDPTRGSLVDRQAQLTRAQIGGAAKTAGFGDLTRAEAGGVQEQGITGDQAGQRFGQLAPMAQGLFAGKTAEEDVTGGGVGRKEALGFVAGQGADEAAIAAARAKRAARFEGGGGAGGSSGRGGTGLGSSGG